MCPELVLYKVVNNHKLHKSLGILGIPMVQGQWWKRDKLAVSIQGLGQQQ